MAVLGNDIQAAVAFTRFGLGGRPDDPLPADPPTWLLAQLNGSDPAPTAGLATQAQCLAMVQQRFSNNANQRALGLAAIRANTVTEVTAYLTNAVVTQVPFRERLVWFWANHFALLSGSDKDRAVAGVFIRDAIRPNVNRTFNDMLLAVMQHPGMLYSLNNDASIGPNSPHAISHLKGTGVQLGLNENLARECLELHTLGVNSPYTQADVDAMANILTGWTVSTVAPVGFLFNASWHEPTSQTLLGNVFPPTLAGGQAALTFLATHPDTYAHLATQLVQHFVSDTPDPGDVSQVQAVLASSGGDLLQASSVLVQLANAWPPQPLLTKFRPPMDHTIAVLRAIGATSATAADIGGVLTTQGQPTWVPPFPNGWSDLISDWLSPAQVLLRTDWVNQLASGLSGLDPFAIAGSSLGPLISQTTAQMLPQLSSVHDQFVVLFCSPEFQRR